MSNQIKIKELSELDIAQLKTDNNFNKVGPVKCGNCGFKRQFIRRFFLVNGMRSKFDRDIARLYIKQIYNLEYCIFRCIKSEEYLESATCPECKSQKVIFDIPEEFAKGMFGKLKNFKENKEDLKNFLKQLRGNSI